MTVANHDGYTVDHFAEFSFMSPESVRVLWEADRVAYEHSICTVLHSLLLFDRIQLPPTTRAPDEYESLRSILGRNGAYQTNPTFQNSSRGTDRPAFNDLEQHWQSIKDLVRDDPKLRDALMSHLKRESWYRKIRSDSERPEGYYIDPSKFELHEGSEAEIFQELQRFYDQFLGQQFDPKVESDWVRSNIATHYLNFFEHRVASGTSYVPGLTRAPVAARLTKKVPAVLDRTIASFAYEMIRKAKNRRQLLDCVLRWINDGPGEKVRSSYRQLGERLSSCDEQEANDHLTAIRRIEASSLSRGFDITLKVLSCAGTAIQAFFEPTEFAGAVDRARELVETVQQPAYVTFLYRYRGGDVKLSHKLQALVEAD